MNTKLPKKVGLALGGGGAKGLAHIGVIKALEEAGIEISFISGTSMGALVGGWYALTKDINKLENIFLKVTEKDMIPMSKIIRKKETGLFKNPETISFLKNFLKNKKIEDCIIPFSAIATDAKNGDEVILKSGNLEEVIHASTALPIVFSPVQYNKKLLIDGGFVNPVPADVVREMGAEYVIAVDVSSKWFNFSEENINLRHIGQIISKAMSVVEYQISRNILKKADVVLHPPVLGYKWGEFSSADEIIKAGKTEAKNHIKEILSNANIEPKPKTSAEKFFDFILYRD